jgi:hypothetical protein
VNFAQVRGRVDAGRTQAQSNEILCADRCDLMGHCVIDEQVNRVEPHAVPVTTGNGDYSCPPERRLQPWRLLECRGLSVRPVDDGSCQRPFRFRAAPGRSSLEAIAI